MNFHSRTTIAQHGLLLTALVATLGLTACDRRDDQTAGQKLDSAIAKTEQKADEAKVATENAANRAEQKIDAATDKMAAKADDVAITAKVNAALAGDPKLSALKIDVDTVDGRVNLSGFAPDAGSRERATELTRAVNGVVSVDNKLEVR
ncbi:BON domain-containing protein [Ideonella sp. DXS29W]|uniref:BON domain-containing protein n=1 Tax=Ideonella lacteola TaxID=2984193 RepID=A0ABU9C0F5_9BURK